MLGAPNTPRMTAGRQREKAATCKLSVISGETNCPHSILQFALGSHVRTEFAVVEAASLWYSAH